MCGEGRQNLQNAKSIAAFANLRHHHVFRFSIKRRAYDIITSSVNLYNSVTWLLHDKRIRRRHVFGHRYLKSIVRVWWEHGAIGCKVRHLELGEGSGPLAEVIDLPYPRWPEHILQM